MKIVQPKHEIIEETALQLAATWYEIGRSQGLTSKYKNAKSYARRNLERFIPNAVEHLTSMLGKNDVPQNQKDIIYEALMERANDPVLKKTIVDLDLNLPGYTVNGENPFKVNN